jgi:diguanylate cyclase (GGDEF)-like protein
MQHLVVPTFVLDRDCNVVIWNKACERLTGVSANDVVGTDDHWRAFYSSPRPCLADLIAQGRTDEINTLYSSWGASEGITAYGIHAENWCVMPNIGSELYLAIDAGPIFDEAGKLIAVVETLRDMTDHKRAQLALEHLATRDGLTGVANRRSLDEKLIHEWRRCLRDEIPLAILMVDVDHFKRFNDAYGHQKGDECLRRVADCAAKVVFRPGDMVARYGGEEFCAILPATDLDGALIVADRIRESVNTLAIPHCGGESGRVTLSIGVACAIPHADTTPDTLLAAADAALYRAKQGGRNRIVTELVSFATTD